MSINRTWDRIESWLVRNAPEAYASLPGSASDESIRSLAEHLGRPLPADLVASLLRHDGSGDLYIMPVGHRLSNVHQIIEIYDLNCRLEVSRRAYAERQNREQPNRFVLLPSGQHYFWSSAWIPVMHDETGSGLFVSLVNDGTFKAVGTMDREDGASFDEHPAFASLSELLENVAAALHVGNLPVWGDWEPYVDTDGFLEWRQNESGCQVV